MTDQRRKKTARPDRAANRAAAYARKMAAARTALERTSVAFDRWRGLVAKLPEEQATTWADVIVKGLDAHSERLTQILDPQGARGE